MKTVLALLIMLCCAPAYAADGERIDQPHKVEDPAYGQILFDYFQQRWFAAMSDTLVALQSNALPTQRNRARVLLGATYVRYGMPDEAEKLFRQLLAESVDPQLASRVWLNLADLYYRRQDYRRALKLLDEKVPPVPAAIRQNYYSLRVRTLMKLGRYEETASVMDHLKSGDPLNAYLKYNLAVSRINEGKGEQGEPLLRQLVALVPGNDEVNAVKDKAILALGLYYLRQKKLDQARQVLGAARLQGPFSDTALLMHAQSWLAGNDPKKALGSLQQLSERSVQTESVQAAMLALPHLYVLLGDAVEAQKRYHAAIRVYNRQYAYTNKLQEDIVSGRWFRKLVTEPAWSTAMDRMPEFEPNRVPSFATFAPLFATDAFQNTWRDYHEVLRQLHLIEFWQQRLPAMQDLIAAQERKHSDDVPAAKKLLAEVRDAHMDSRLKDLHDRLQTAISDDDYRQFATDKEEHLFEALDEAQKRADRWKGKMPGDIYNKLDFYRGVLAWQVQKDIVPREWQRIRKLQELRSLLNRQHDYVQRVQSAAADDRGRLQYYRSEYADLSQALARLHARGEKLLARNRIRIESLALTQLKQTRQRLVQFTALAWDSLGDLDNEAVRQKRRSQLPSGSRSSE